jgi:hypothetical protein
VGVFLVLDLSCADQLVTRSMDLIQDISAPLPHRRCPQARARSGLIVLQARALPAMVRAPMPAAQQRSLASAHSSETSAYHRSPTAEPARTRTAAGTDPAGVVLVPRFAAVRPALHVWLARVRARAHRIPTWIRSSSSSGCVARLTSVRMCAARPGLKPDPAALLCADDDGDAGPVRAAADRAAAERVLRAVRPRPPQPPPPPPPPRRPPHAHIHVHTPQDSPS